MHECLVINELRVAVYWGVLSLILLNRQMYVRENATFPIVL